MSETVTAIIPTTGRAELLRAIRSVNHQSLPTDTMVVAALPDLHNRIETMLAEAELKATVLPTNRALNGSEARNRGVAASTTELIAFLDDDDWWEKDKTCKQVKSLKGQEGTPSISTTGSKLLQRDGRDSGRAVPQKPYSGGRVSDYLLERRAPRFGHHFMQTSSLMGPRELFLKHPWNEQLQRHQDWDLFIRLIDGADVNHIFVSDTLTYVAVGSANSVSASRDFEASLEWVESVHASSRSKNDFLLTIPATHALRAGDADGVLKSLGKLEPVMPHLGAIAAFTKEAVFNLAMMKELIIRGNTSRPIE